VAGGQAGARAVRGKPFDATERAALLERFFAAYRAADAAELARPERDASPYRAEMAELARAYVDAVPILPVSRSPLSGELFETSLDTFGIDGLWWAYDHEYRPYVPRPADLYGFSGALKVDGPLPDFSLKAMPGPDVPFVLPALMAHPGMVAVLSAVRIGTHVGFPITYWALPQPDGVERVDDWGARSFTYQRADGSMASGHAVQADGDKDFDLGPWLASGRLRWISPGDESLTLRAGADGCPYLDLPGERRRRYLQEGDTWLA
jgi:hypothetical protein